MTWGMKDAAHNYATEEEKEHMSTEEETVRITTWTHILKEGGSMRSATGLVNRGRARDSGDGRVQDTKEVRRLGEVGGGRHRWAAQGRMVGGGRSRTKIIIQISTKISIIFSCF